MLPLRICDLRYAQNNISRFKKYLQQRNEAPDSDLWTTFYCIKSVLHQHSLLATPTTTPTVLSTSFTPSLSFSPSNSIYPLSVSSFSTTGSGDKFPMPTSSPPSLFVPMCVEEEEEEADSPCKKTKQTEKEQGEEKLFDIPLDSVAVSITKQEKEQFESSLLVMTAFFIDQEKEAYQWMASSSSDDSSHENSEEWENDAMDQD